MVLLDKLLPKLKSEGHKASAAPHRAAPLGAGQPPAAFGQGRAGRGALACGSLPPAAPPLYASWEASGERLSFRPSAAALPLRAGAVRLLYLYYYYT